ncbi:hypothetical protein BTR22_04785 [Alkalihalophilus pseudofirmus]|uniref:4'-phosphopantetheinyl transferase superfamily protein n=1 Tax=Alkalihalophilus pseudofirmus TaxID=79885 RepID=UPI000950C376|nr:hypothetical protein BTR22_04785 [Alkalihalophilus pseudofirmus]
MKIFGLGVDIVDMNRVQQPHVIEQSFTTDEQRYLETSVDKVKDSSVLFAVKEAFIKAASGHVSFSDLKKVSVKPIDNNYFISYDENDFMKNKQCWITANVFPDYTIASVTIVTA